MFLGLGLGVIGRQGLGRIFPDGQELRNWHTTNAITVPLVTLNRNAYRQDNAQAIRDGAGLPVGVTTGIESGVTPGYSGSLVAQSTYNINNETDAQNLASSGVGTENDPYIIELKEFDGAGIAVRGLNFNDSDADYHVKLRNCLFHDFANEGLRINWSNTAKVTIENCTFYNTSGTAALIRRIAGNLELSACVFSGCDTFGAYVDNSSSDNAAVTMRNIMITDNNGAWSSGGDVFQIKAQNTSFDMRHIEVENGIVGNESVFQLMGCASDSVLSNIKFSGGFDYFLTDNDDTSASKGFTFEYFEIADSRRELVYLQNVDGANIRYGNASHNTGGTNYRVIFFESDSGDNTRRVQNIDVEYVKITKATGTKIAGNEALESWYGENIHFRYCWITESKEDGFEHVYSLGGCTVEYCVGDNIAGQVVDFFKKGEISGAGFAVITDTLTITSASADYIHHIYGDTTSDHGVIVSGTAWSFGHDIYVDTSAAATNKAVFFAQDRDGVVARNIHFAGPFSLPRARSREAILFEGGENVVTCYFDNEDATGTVVPVFEGLNQLLDASDSTTLTPATGDLTNWNDKSFYANALSQDTTANSPTTGLATQNSLNILEFDGSSDHVDGTNLTFLNSSNPWTIFMLFRADDVTTTSTLMSASVGSTDRVALAISAGELRAGVYSGTSFAHAGSEDIVVGTWYLATVSYDGSASFSFKLNDTAVSKTSSPTTASNPNTISLGAKPSAATPLNGAIAEFRVYNRMLLAAEQTKIFEHLKYKWAF